MLTISDAELFAMHPQSVAAKYQQAHRIERRRARMMMIAHHAPKAFEDLSDY